MSVISRFCQRFSTSLGGATACGGRSLVRLCATATRAVKAQHKSYTPRRALMYVPASDEKKLAKLPVLTVDCVVLDCEDGVAMTRKEEARSNVAQLLSSGKIDYPNIVELGVRVNSVSSGLMNDDFKAISASKRCPTAIMLPKVESVNDLGEFCKLFQKYYPAVDHEVHLVLWIESARALLGMFDILRASKNLSTFSPLVADAVVFGSDDFTADIGAMRSNEATEVLYARQKFVTICKAFQLQAIDVVYTDFKDLEGLKRQSEEGRRFGFTGKQVIHPDQVPVVHQAFMPSEEQVKWAQELVAEFDQHQKSGKGAFTFRGNMVDMPVVLQARNIIDMYQKVKK